MFLERLEIELPDVDIVSFDVFDTAVRRKGLHPEAVYKFLGITYFERKYAQRVANRVCRHVGLEEIKYDDILRYIRPWKRSIVAGREVSLERAVSEAIPEIHEAWKRAIEAGKKVIFISDMYLPGDIVWKVLQSCGYEVNRQDVFVSSDIGLTKRTGNLFRAIQGELSAQYPRWIHIGDNERSDIQRAEELGIRALHFKGNQCALLSAASGRNVYASLVSGLDHIIPINADPWWKFGYRVMGPLLTSFSLWLEREARNDGCTILLFLSRDGWLLSQCYRELKKVGRNVPHSRYFYASRGAITGAIHDSQQRLALRAYVARLGVKKGDTIGIVDVGWQGTIQRGLQSLLEYNGISVLGYYLATSDKVPNGKGFICDARRPRRLWVRVAEGKAVLETVTSAPHGRVDRYQLQRGEGRAVFDRSSDLRGKKEGLRRLRIGARAFCRQVLTNAEDLYSEFIHHSVASSRLLDVISNPDPWSAHEIGGITHSGGVLEEDLQQLAEPIDMQTGLVSTIREIRKRHWSTAALRRSVSERHWPLVRRLYQWSSMSRRLWSAFRETK